MSFVQHQKNISRDFSQQQEEGVRHSSIRHNEEDKESFYTNNNQLNLSFSLPSRTAPASKQIHVSKTTLKIRNLNQLLVSERTRFEQQIF